jgi:WD40 repeat protein
MPAQSQSFGADDNSLATLHSDARVRIWDVVSGKVQRSFRVNDKANVFQQGHFSGNGRLLAVSKASPATHKTRLKWWKSSKRSRPVLRGTVDVYSVETGRLKDTAHGDIGRVVISDDGERLLRIDGAALVLTDRRRKGGNVPYTENVWDVFAASPDGQTVAAEVFPKLQRGTTKRPSPVVLVWNAKIGGLQHTLRTEDDVMQWRSLCYSSEGKLIAAGGFRMPIGATKAESIVQLWDVNTGKLTRTIETEQSSVEDMAFSPDGKTLATGGLTGTLKLWRIRR